MFPTRGAELFRVEQALGGMMENGVTGQRTSRKVLIVEDNELNMKLFNDLLEAHGYTTFQTKDGREALNEKGLVPRIVGELGGRVAAGRRIRSAVAALVGDDQTVPGELRRKDRPHPAAVGIAVEQ